MLSTELRTAQRTVRAMGCTAELYVAGGETEAILDELCGLLVALERCWSRFDPASELSRLNARDGAMTVVSTDLFDAVAIAVDGAYRTEERFTPLVGGAMQALGYDTTWRSVDLDSNPGEARPVPSVTELRLVPTSHLVTLPLGASLDLGGMGKGLAADRALARARELGAAAASISVGGDLACGRFTDEHAAFPCLIESMDRVLAETTFERSGAIATSSSEVRRFADGRHHIIDPRTGASSTSPVRTVSVLAASAAWAEMAATAMAVSAPDEALQLATELDVACVLELQDGIVRTQGSSQHGMGS